MEFVEIGQRRCPTVRRINQSRLVCEGIQGPWDSDRVRVAIGNQVSREEALLQIAPDPAVQAIVSNAPGGVNSITGNYSFVLSGDGFGFVPADVLGVSIGSQQSPRVAFRSSQSVEVDVPPGIGSSLPVRVHRRDGLVSRPVLFSYAAQRITRVEPPYMLPGVGNVSVRLEGSDLANDVSQLTIVSLGEYPCENILVESSSRVRCELNGVTDWPNSDVRVVRSDGSQLVLSTVFEGYGNPSVASIEPDIGAVEGGTNATIAGTNFGT